MKRRNFVQSIALSSVGAPLLLKDFNFGVVTKELFSTSRGAEDRVLVLIRLNGGNDGLNTLIPIDQYDKLMIQRKNVMIPQNKLLKITDTNSLHPSMPGLRDIYNSGKMAIIQNVGYPEQNRSHFRSMDIWSTGLTATTGTTGWLGRHLDKKFPNFPDNYPNTQNPDPFAISMGYEVSATCQGLMANFSHTVNDPLEDFNLQEATNTNDGTYYGSHMEYLAKLIAQSNDYGQQVKSAAESGSSLSTKYDATNPLAIQLRNVAKMISGGLKTKIYILNINGFDTHDAQVSETDTSAGNHAELLKMLSDAVAAFMDDVKLLGLDKRVAGMTFSEFGRQIASNASLGTDHGDAAPLFLFGGCVNAGIVGPNPTIGSQIKDQDGVPMKIDFRDVYASVLKDWFEVAVADIQGMFEHTVKLFPVLSACNLGVNEVQEDENELLVYPNPCVEFATIRIRTESEFVQIAVFDLQGKLVQNVVSKNLGGGEHHIKLDTDELVSGQYLVSVLKKSGNFNTRFVKVKNN